MIGPLGRILRRDKVINRYSTERFRLDIAGNEVHRPLEFCGCIAYECPDRGRDPLAEDGSRKRLAQCSRRPSSPVKNVEKSPFAAPQLLFVLKKVTRGETIDILGYYGLRKTIVKETRLMVDTIVVHLVLQQPERIECLCLRCFTFRERVYYRLSRQDHRGLFQEEGAASGDALDRVEINGAGEEECMPAMVSAVNHGDNLVGIKAVACQHLRDLPSQRRFSTNDLKPGGMMGDPETAPEDRLQCVRERAMADIMKQPGDCEKVGCRAGRGVVSWRREAPAVRRRHCGRSGCVCSGTPCGQRLRRSRSGGAVPLDGIR